MGYALGKGRAKRNKGNIRITTGENFKKNGAGTAHIILLLKRYDLLFPSGAKLALFSHILI
jgi:hypothetical protein